MSISMRNVGRLRSCSAMLLGAALAIAQPCLGAAGSSNAQAVDLRPTFEAHGLSARAQGGRGTCSVFTVVGAIEYALADKQQRGTRLSVEFLNWASNRTIGKARDGGYFSDLWKGFEAHGICPESDLPYRPQFDPKLRPPTTALESARQAQQAGLRMHWIKPWNPNTGLTDGQLAEIKQALRRKWPVCGGFRWPKKERWNDGVLEMAPPEGVRDGHSVLLVGYRDDAALPGGGVFLLRNSGKGLRHGSMTYQYAGAYMNDAVWIDHAPAAKAAN